MLFQQKNYIFEEVSFSELICFPGICARNRFGGIVAWCWFAAAVGAPGGATAQFRHESKRCNVEVYLTADDMRRGNGVEATKINSEIHFTSGSRPGLIDAGSGQLSAESGPVFGYQDDNCETYRYLNGHGFVELLYKDGPFLYSLAHLRTGDSAKYFFSKTSVSPLIQLTKKNLIAEYAHMPGFVRRVRELVSDDQLYYFDRVNGKYLVANLYTLSQN